MQDPNINNKTNAAGYQISHLYLMLFHTSTKQTHTPWPVFQGEENNTRTAIQSLTNSSLHIRRSKTETATHNQKYFPRNLFLLSLLHSFLFHSLSLSLSA
jgi:hypothetical protein